MKIIKSGLTSQLIYIFLKNILSMAGHRDKAFDHFDIIIVYSGTYYSCKSLEMLP